MEALDVIDDYRGMPREEDVTTVDVGQHRLQVVKVTEENQDYLVKVALSMYVGEPCRICGVLLTWETIREAVWAGYSKDSAARAAHKECWENNPMVDDQVPKEWVHQ